MSKNTSTLNQRIIAHIDMNSYFASVEQQARPALRGRAIAVTGPSKRTIIVAASIEAKRLGIKTGTQIGEAKKLCPDIVLVKADCRRYESISAQLISIFDRFTPTIEIFSIDEAFLDLTDTVQNFDQAAKIVSEIKSRIRQEIGTNIRCSAGIAQNKFIAKLASEAKKPDGLTVVPAGEEINFLDQFDLTDACGIGHRTAKHLDRLKIHSFKDLRNIDQTTLTLIFKSYGLRLYNISRGQDNSPVVPYLTGGKPKSISRSKTLPKDIYDKDYIEKIGLFFCTNIAYELKKQGLLAGSLGLYLRFSDFSFDGCGAKISSPTALSSNLHFYFKKSLKKLRISKPVRKVGVWAGGLTEDNGQMVLSDNFDNALKLEKTAENINKKFAKNVVIPSSLAGLDFEQSPSYGFQKKFLD